MSGVEFGRFIVVPIQSVGGKPPTFKIVEKSDNGQFVKSSKTFYDEHQAYSQAIAWDVEERFSEVLRTG